MKKQFSVLMKHTHNLLACYLLFIALVLSSCEVFKTTPRTSRGPQKRPVTSSHSARTTSVTPSPNAYSRNVPEVVKIARTYVGTPYRSGGNDRRGIDCSGLISQVYSEIGFKVPRISWQQSEFGEEVIMIEDIKPGDWLFFVPEAGKEGYVSHAGIVTEVRGKQDIWFIHASSSKGVREDNLYSTYFKNRFAKAMRPFATEIK